MNGPSSSLPSDNILAYYWYAALSRWKLLLGIVAGLTLFGWAFSVLVLAQKPTFESTARLNIVPTGEELGYASRFARGQNADGGLVMAQTYAEYLRSREVREAVVDRWISEQALAVGVSSEEWLREQAAEAKGWSLGALIAFLNYGEVPKTPLRDELVEELGENTEIEMIEGTFLMQLTIGWDTAADAAWFANSLADEVIAEANALSEESGESLAGILQKELAEKQAELAQLKQTSRSRKISLGVVDIDAQKQALLQEQIAEQSRLTSDLADSRRSSAQVSALESQQTGKLGDTQKNIEEQLAVARPVAVAARQSISARQARLGAIDNQLSRLSRAELGIKTLDDQTAVVEAEVRGLLERLRFSQTENLANRATIRLLDRAEVPLVRASPKILLNTILAFAAGCAIAGIVLLLLGPKTVRRSETVSEHENESWTRGLAARWTGRSPREAPREYDPASSAERSATPFFQSASTMPEPTAEPSKASLNPDVVLHPSAYRAFAPRSETPAFPSGADTVIAMRPMDQRQPYEEPVTDQENENGEDRTNPILLPTPATGRYFAEEEVRELAPYVFHWLGSEVGASQDLHIAALAGQAGAGRRLAKLVFDCCAFEKRQARAIRGRGPSAQLQRDPGDTSLRIFLHEGMDAADLCAFAGASKTVALALHSSEEATIPQLGDHFRNIGGNELHVALFDDL